MADLAGEILNFVNTGIDMAKTGVTNYKNFKRSKELMNYQNELNRKNWNDLKNYQNYLNNNEFSIKMQAARNAGLSPMAAIAGSNFNSQVGSIPSPSASSSGTPPPPSNLVQGHLAAVQADSTSKLATEQAELLKQQAEELKLRNENTKSSNDTIDFVFSLNPDYKEFKNSGIKFNQGLVQGLDSIYFNAANKAEGLSRQAKAAFDTKVNTYLQDHAKEFSEGMVEQMRGYFITNQSMLQKIEESKQNISESKKRMKLMDSQININGVTYKKIETETSKLWIDMDAIKQSMEISKLDSYGKLIEGIYNACESNDIETMTKLSLTLALKYPSPKSFQELLVYTTGGRLQVVKDIERVFNQAREEIEKQKHGIIEHDGPVKGKSNPNPGAYPNSRGFWSKYFGNEGFGRGHRKRTINGDYINTSSFHD